MHPYVAIVLAFHGGGNGVSGPWWLVGPIVVVGGIFRLWQWQRSRRR